MMLEFFIDNYFLIFLAGMGGAFVADILKDNCIELPKKIDGKFFLGSLGGFLIGGIAGVTIDGSLLTAFMAGFMGKEVITRLINGFPLTQNQKDIKSAIQDLDIPCDATGKTAP